MRTTNPFLEAHGTAERSTRDPASTGFEEIDAQIEQNLWRQPTTTRAGDTTQSSNVKTSGFRDAPILTKPPFIQEERQANQRFVRKRDLPIKLCSNLKGGGKCKDRTTCSFNHIFRNIANGLTCPNGERCWYEHDVFNVQVGPRSGSIGDVSAADQQSTTRFHGDRSTTFCKSLKSGGRCKRRLICPYNHQCTAISTGKECLYGDKCWYEHSGGSTMLSQLSSPDQKSSSLTPHKRKEVKVGPFG